MPAARVIRSTARSLFDLDALLAAVVVAPPDVLVEVNGGVPTRWDVVAQLYPRSYRRLTPEWMRSFVVTEVARVAAVADSTEYLVERSQSPFGGVVRDVLTVQHRLSGLRATFFSDDGEKIGRVLAKSYSIRSIDPDRSWDGEGLQAVREWEGLGITSGIYQHGAALQPGVRWRAARLTDQSARMRRRLHQIDPWRFEAARNPEQHPHDTCLWCLHHGWERLDRNDFSRHLAQWAR